MTHDALQGLPRGHVSPGVYMASREPLGPARNPIFEFHGSNRYPRSALQSSVTSLLQLLQHTGETWPCHALTVDGHNAYSTLASVDCRELRTRTLQPKTLSGLRYYTKKCGCTEETRQDKTSMDSQEQETAAQRTRDSDCERPRKTEKPRPSRSRLAAGPRHTYTCTYTLYPSLPRRASCAPPP